MYEGLVLDSFSVWLLKEVIKSRNGKIGLGKNKQKNNFFVVSKSG